MIRVTLALAVNERRVLRYLHKLFPKIASLFCLVICCSCSSSNTRYYGNDVSLISGETAYFVEEVSIKLLSAREEAKSPVHLLSPAQLKATLRQSLASELSALGIACEIGSLGCVAGVRVDVEYQRKLFFGGKSLSRPYVKHYVTVVSSNGALLATNFDGLYVPRYSLIDDGKQVIKEAYLVRDITEEQRDIELIARRIAKDIYEFETK